MQWNTILDNRLKEVLDMATVYDYYKHYVHIAIGTLREKGLLRSELDWDICKGKFTLRLFRSNGSPSTILVIEFRRRDNTIIVIDTNTHQQMEFMIDIKDKNNKTAFLDLLFNYLRDQS